MTCPLLDEIRATVAPTQYIRPATGNRGMTIEDAAIRDRVLRLTDLTVQVQRRPAFRRELLRWRDLIAALYVSAEPSPGEHRAAFRALLRFTPAASAQIPAALGP